MTTTLNSLTTDLDYLAFCEERLQDPYPLYHRLRTEDPVHYCEPMNLWLVTRYEDVLAGLRDPRLSSDRTGMYTQALPEELKVRVQPLLNHVSKWIQLTDEPEHGRLRKLVNAAFTPKMINTLRPGIENLAAELLDGLDRQKSFDLIEKFSGPLPAIIICQMLGIPDGERDRFRESTEQLMKFSARGGPSLKDHAVPAHAALNDLISLFERLVDERRREPREDLLSSLVSAVVDGERLTNEELYAMCVFIFMAGHETTTNGIASGVLALLRNPDQYARFIENQDEMVGGLVDEALRYESPVPRAVRRANEDLLIGGKSIPAGSHVVLMLGAANRDPDQFPNPDCFDIARRPNRHLAFGFGLHFCLGAQLAKIELGIAFRVIAKQFPNLRLAGAELDWKPVMGIRALKNLIVEDAEK